MALGNGISFARMALVSSGGVGLAMTDVMFGTFIVDSLRTFGASTLVALCALALGALASIVFAPFVGAFGGRSVKLRKSMTLICFSIAAAAAFGIAFLVGSHSPSQDGPREPSNLKVAILVALAAIYRGAAQSAPIVPLCIDAASTKVKGDEEMSDARVSIGLSFFYLSYRLGFLISQTILAAMPKRNVDRLLPPFAGAALVFVLGIITTAMSMPSGPLDSDEKQKKDEEPSSDAQTGEPAPTPPSAFSVAKGDIKATLLDASTRLKFVYVETLFFGIAFGQLAAITAPFYNEVIFGKPPGSSNGIAWSAYSGLISFIAGFVHDAVIGGLAFSRALSTSGMTVFWVIEMLTGAGLFASLYVIDDKFDALLVFGFLVVATSSHNYFSLVAGGALVEEPRHRPAAFGIRAASLQLGWLIGNVGAAIASSGGRGFRPVMLMSAVACGCAAIAALVVGTVERPKFQGVATNANPLFKYISKREDGFKDAVIDDVVDDLAN